MTQVEFAKKLGIDRTYLAKLETGGDAISKKMQQRLKPYGYVVEDFVLNIYGID